MPQLANFNLQLICMLSSIFSRLNPLKHPFEMQNGWKIAHYFLNDVNTFTSIVISFLSQYSTIKTFYKVFLYVLYKLHFFEQEYIFS